MGSSEAKTILVESIELPELSDQIAGDPSQPLLSDPQTVIDEIAVTLEVRMGSVQLNVKDLRTLRTGSVVTLDRSVEDPVDVYVNGRLVARGELVACGDAFGVRFTELFLNTRS
jgi:flagellar motor switch protein FliN